MLPVSASDFSYTSCVATLRGKSPHMRTVCCAAPTRRLHGREGAHPVAQRGEDTDVSPDAALHVGGRGRVRVPVLERSTVVRYLRLQRADGLVGIILQYSSRPGMYHERHMGTEAWGGTYWFSNTALLASCRTARPPAPAGRSTG